MSYPRRFAQRRSLMVIVLLAAVAASSGCNSDLLGFIFSDDRLLGKALAAGPKHEFAVWQFDDFVSLAAGTMSMSGGLTGTGGVFPTQVQIFLTRIAANGRAADKFSMTVKIDQAGQFVPTTKKFKGLDLEPGDSLQAHLKFKAAGVPAFSTMEYALEYEAG